MLVGGHSSNYETLSGKQAAPYGRKTHQQSRCPSFYLSPSEPSAGCHASCLPVFVSSQSVRTLPEIEHDRALSSRNTALSTAESIATGWRFDKEPDRLDSWGVSHLGGM